MLLLDRPLQLGSPVDSQDGTFYLDRIRLRDLSGWPPRLAAPRGDLGPPLLDCRLIAARFKRANASGQEGLEFDLVYQGTVYSAWLLGCPLPLLIGALKTLNAPGVFGNRLVDVQEMRLIGEGKGS